MRPERTVHLYKLEGEDNIAVQFVALKHYVNDEGKERCDITRVNGKLFSMTDPLFIKETVLWLREAKLAASQ